LACRFMASSTGEARIVFMGGVTLAVQCGPSSVAKQNPRGVAE
jgi:hypothetical protein